MSGEDEPMVIVASDAEVHTEELRFSRSLMFLRDFIHGIRERPEYAVSTERVPVTTARTAMVNSDQGDTIQIRCQTFPADPEGPALRELEISKVESSQTLRDHLREVTGFDHFRIICSGQELDLDREPTRTVAELPLGPQPLMITKRDKPPVRMLHSASSEGLTKVEVELLKHFDDLYDLLGLEDKLASQVSDLLRDASLIATDIHLALGLLECFPTPQSAASTDHPRRPTRCCISRRSALQDYVLGHDDASDPRERDGNGKPNRLDQSTTAR